MFTQPVLDRGKAAVATLLALLLLIAGAITAPPAHAAAPAVSATAAPRAGGTVTVTGSGFAAAYPGVYVGYGVVGAGGFYAGGSGDPVHVAVGNVEGGSTGARTAPMNPDGSFSVTLTLPAYSDGTQYAIYTSKAHGQGFADPSQNTTASVAWQPAPAVATTTTLTVDPAASSVAGATFTLGATVEPAASGTVAYFRGAEQIGQAPVGTAVATSVATAGTVQLSAVFTPADAAAFTGSTSATVDYTITAPPVTEPEVPEEPETPVFEPAVQVFRADGVTPVTGTIVAGESIVVKGTGFDPAANVGGRGVPIPSTLPQGTYVVFGHFGENWQPSAGAASSQRKVVSQKWALAEGVLNQVPSQYQGAIRSQWADISADGSFSATLTVSETTTPVAGGSYGVYTYGAGGVTNAAQELSVPLSFAPVFEPAIEVFRADGTTPVTGTVDEGETLVVKGAGFDPAANVGGRGVPIPSTLPQGTYVVFGHFGENWQPSTGAASAQRKVGSQKWALAEGVLNQVPSQYQGAIRSQWTDIAADGSFTTTLTATVPATLVDGGRFGVYTYGAGGVTNADQELSVPLSFALPTPEVDLTVAAVDRTAGATIGVVGSNFGDITGAYAAIIEKGTESELDMDGGYVAFGYWMTPGAIVDGAFEKTLVAPTEKLDRTKTYELVVWKGHTEPTAETIYARADVPFTPQHWDILFPGTTTPPSPEPTNPPPTTPIASGSLRWAISSSFTEYVVGSIAKGAVSTANGATRSGGVFQFGQAAGATFDASAGTGSVSYLGSVRFTGHAGVLDVTVANPQIRATSPTTAALYVTSGGSQVHFANLDLAAAQRTTANGSVTFAGAPATLTAAGRSQVFQGFSTSLDPITFTVGVAGLPPTGASGTVAAAPAQQPSRAASVPATPPTTSGIQLDDATLAALQAGEPVDVSVPGFAPNEEGILVVVYSTPIVLDEITADASGVATWSGSLPATLADGEHTLTFQGSVDRGIRFTLARAASPLAGCVVSDASLNWGFKESFRTYIEGIAAGGWELTDVVYDFPEFVWSGGSGTVDATAKTGLVTYGGSIRFSGHGGALDTTLSDARIELAGDTGYVVLDIAGTTQSGSAVAQEGVRFAEFALPDLELTDEGLVLDALPATLTDAGAAAFGTYAAGEELDAVSGVLPVDAACGEPVATTTDAEEPVAEAAQSDPVAVEPVSSAPVWPWAVGGTALLVMVGAAVWIVVARRRAAHGGTSA